MLKEMNLPPSRLCIKGGVLQMQDGSAVQAYLGTTPLADSQEVVILSRALAERLVDDANEGRLARLNRLTADERFALAA